MSNHTLLGRLSGLHQMMSDLLQALPEPAVRTTTHPALAPPGPVFRPRRLPGDLLAARGDPG
ncbi:MAG: hypothetical protein AB2814_07855 [Candidatus Sedimenticola endophacoides]